MGCNEQARFLLREIANKNPSILTSRADLCGAPGDAMADDGVRLLILHCLLVPNNRRLAIFFFFHTSICGAPLAVSPSSPHRISPRKNGGSWSSPDRSPGVAAVAQAREGHSGRLPTPRWCLHPSLLLPLPVARMRMCGYGSRTSDSSLL